jgi:hypothetical protein
VLLIPFLPSCKKKGKIIVTEQRELTMFDDERDPMIAVMPPEWRQVPATEFRIYNYRFGEDGEVFVGRSRGGLLANANRWLGQFSQAPLESVEELPKVEVLGQEGILVTASGRFVGGMGKPARENAGLVGVIIQAGDSLLTVKMMGDADAVTAERERLIQFAKSLRMRDSSSTDNTN